MPKIEPIPFHTGDVLQARCVGGLPDGELLREIAGELGRPCVEVGTDPNGGTRRFLVRDGYHVHHAPPATVGVPAHTFHDVRSFGEWLNCHADAGTAQVLVGEGLAIAHVDPQDPNGARVMLLMRHHPRVERWLGVLGKNLTQEGFSELLTAGRRDTDLLQDSAGHDIGWMGTELAEQARNFALAFSGDLKRRVDQHGVVRFSGATSEQTVSGQLPPEFSVHVPFFLGVELHGEEPLYTLELGIGISTRGGEPAFVLRAPALDEVAYEARLDLVTHLRDVLHDDFLVGMGEATVDLRVWHRHPSQYTAGSSAVHDVKAWVSVGAAGWRGADPGRSDPPAAPEGGAPAHTPAEDGSDT